MTTAPIPDAAVEAAMQAERPSYDTRPGPYYNDRERVVRVLTAALPHLLPMSMLLGAIEAADYVATYHSHHMARRDAKVLAQRLREAAGEP